MYDEDDLLPISAIQHLAFCERQWGLIYLEGVWDENVLTVEGARMHDRTHGGEAENRGDVRIVRGLRLRSLRLGLCGRADVVEFHRVRGGPAAGAVPLADAPGRWVPVPVEYKRGRPKQADCDRAQLCAQALCLEEMLGVPVPTGALFYGRTRRRCEVAMGVGLRARTEALARRLHELTRLGVTPPPTPAKHCASCSVAGWCLPRAVTRRSARGYLRDTLRQMREDD